MNSKRKPIIVAVDDEAIIVNSVLSILKDDYQVRPFTSGQSALNYLEKQPADLILMDYQMPGMSGIEALEKIQRNPKTNMIPVMFLTGSVDDNTEVQVLEKGAVDYILKPIKPKVLLTRIRLQLELQDYRNHLEMLVDERTQDLHLAYNKLRVREELTVDLLARATDLRDHDTGAHLKRTTEFTRLIVEHILDNPKPGYELGMYEAEDIIKSVKLHDIGKVAIPDQILLKPGKLTPDEFDVIKKHTVYGGELLDDFIKQMNDDSSFLNVARDIACYHHEKWNGQGYPTGLAGENIPLSARITALADVYDALTSIRPYKKAFTHEASLEIIQKDSGSHFDPYLVSIFEQYSDQIKHIAETIVSQP